LRIYYYWKKSLFVGEGTKQKHYIRRIIDYLPYELGGVNNGKIRGIRGGI